MSLAVLAWLFHWPPGELLAMTSEDLTFWAARVDDLERARKAAQRA